MKTLTSIAIGTLALAAASIGLAQPAAARDTVGIYVSPFGIGVSVDGHRNYCSDDWYRRYHWDYCSRFYRGYDNGYSNNYFNGYYSNGYRFSHNDRDDRNHRRDDRYGSDRHDQGNRGDGERGAWGSQGGERGDHNHGR